MSTEDVKVPERVAKLLTEREIAVLKLIVGPLCMTTAEAAMMLHISERTVEVHRAAIMKKTAAKNVVALARLVLVPA